MPNPVLCKEIEDLANRAKANDQLAIASILYAIGAAMKSGCEVEFAQFARVFVLDMHEQIKSHIAKLRTLENYQEKSDV